MYLAKYLFKKSKKDVLHISNSLINNTISDLTVAIRNFDNFQRSEKYFNDLFFIGRRIQKSSKNNLVVIACDNQDLSLEFNGNNFDLMNLAYSVNHLRRKKFLSIFLSKGSEQFYHVTLSKQKIFFGDDLPFNSTIRNSSIHDKPIVCEYNLNKSKMFLPKSLDF